jgi:hypothetical protein
MTPYPSYLRRKGRSDSLCCQGESTTLAKRATLCSEAVLKAEGSIYTLFAM